MWSIGISASPCTDAERIGYDFRQINRIVIRMAQFFLGRNMRVIFGHDWREDGVMRAIADFANKVAVGAKNIEQESDQLHSEHVEDEEQARMLNVVPTGQKDLSKAALNAQNESGGVLKVIPANEVIKDWQIPELVQDRLVQEKRRVDERAAELTALRCYITNLLDPGCRICLGGETKGYEGAEPGVMEEARLALEYGKPLYLLGGFGGATRIFGEKDSYGSSQYWKIDNGLDSGEMKNLFEATDIELALRIIAAGIEKLQDRV